MRVVVAGLLTLVLAGLMATGLRFLPAGMTPPAALARAVYVAYQPGEEAAHRLRGAVFGQGSDLPSPTAGPARPAVHLLGEAVPAGTGGEAAPPGTGGPQALATVRTEPASPGTARGPVSDLDRHYAYILASQLESGAIAMTPQHLLINPYFANLAARALLTRPEHAPAVERWMDWYLSHLNADGTIDDYRVDEDRELSTGRYDSADSYAATFLSVVAAYLRTGGDPAWVEENREALDRVAGVITDLTDESGLTWAKRYYPLKLLMDNAEVAAGWTDWAEVLEALGDAEGAEEARRRSERIREGLSRFEQDEQTYAWALAPLGLRKSSKVERFYPDAVAQLFPLAFGVTDDPSSYERFTEAHPAWTDLDSDHFPWVFTAYAAVRAGDAERAEAALKSVGELFPDLAPPWYVAESAWLIRTAEAMTESKPVP